MRRGLLAASLWLALATGACQHVPRADGEWIATIMAADPAFGGGTPTYRRLLADTKWFAKGDARQRELCVREQMSECDRVAAALVAQAAPDAEPAVVAFWRSDAGNALATGEICALAMFPQPEAFFAEFAALASDPTRVGEAARQQVRQAFANDTGGLQALSFAIGATRVRPEHAPEIAAFYASDAGKRWLEIRTRALPTSNRQFFTFATALTDRGLLGSVYDGMDLTLPRAVFDEPGGTGH